MASEDKACEVDGQLDLLAEITAEEENEKTGAKGTDQHGQ